MTLDRIMETRTMTTNHRQCFRVSSWLMGLLTLALLLGATPSGQAQSADGIKVAFIYNFSRFVKWPKGTVDGSFKVGFVGDTPLKSLFARSVKGKNAGGKPFEIVDLSGASGAEACQIVFVADAAKASEIIGALKDKPVMTIGNDAGFADSGGVVGFVTGKKVTFHLNLGAAESGKLKVDTKLQKIAVKVKS